MSGLGLSPSSAPDPLPTATAAAQADTVAALHRGANWLFVIAGLSVVNVVGLVSGSQWIFLGGLAVSYAAAAVAIQLGSAQVQLIALVVNIWATACFVSLGFFARKGRKWAFITGMALYAADMLLVLYVQMWLMFLFHCFVLYRLYQGYSSSSALHAFDRRDSGAGMPAQP